MSSMQKSSRASCLGGGSVSSDVITSASGSVPDPLGSRAEPTQHVTSRVSRNVVTSSKSAAYHETCRVVVVLRFTRRGKRTETGKQVPADRNGFHVVFTSETGLFGGTHCSTVNSLFSSRLHCPVVH